MIIMDVNVINVIKGSTRTRVQISLQHPHALLLRDMFKGILSDYDWNKRLHSYELMNRYYYYSKRNSEFVIPASYTKDVINEIKLLNVPMIESNETLIKGRRVKLKMIKSFRPKPNQVEAIEYLSQDSPYNKGLSLMTGAGKTVVTIAAIARRGKAAMVVTSGLTEQWYQSFIRFTNCHNRVVVVQGIQSLMKLMDSNDRPDVIIFSLETLRRYVNREENYKDIPPYETFIKYFGIDTKVVDECHQNFHANTLIDLHSNILNNIYLTATFTSSNAQTKKIFDRIYPPDIRFGASVRERYIDIWSYGYRCDVPEKCYMKAKGYSHHGYEKYFYKRVTKLQWFFETVLSYVIDEHYERRCKAGAKCLIFFSQLIMIEEAAKFLEHRYPNRKVGIYVGESEDTAYNDYEIIVSNAKKAGTGKDIPNLYVVINTISFSSPTLTEQMLGRLRKLPDGTTPHYIEVVNLMSRKHMRQRMDRQEIHHRLARNYIMENIP